MNDRLLEYYNRELAYLRRLGGEYAAAHPKIAGRLRLGPESSEDPHVERLIQAVALLTSRVRLKLDDEFPDVVDGMLDVLYPHFLRPVPSMTIARFGLDPTDGQGASGYRIPAGSEVDTEPVDGEPIRFRSCYDVTLWPIAVKEAECVGRPFSAPVIRGSGDAAAVIRIRLECPADELGFGDLPVDRLRFFLHGMPQYVHRLYEAIHADVLGIAIADGAKDPEPIVLPPSAIRPVGFEPDEGLLPFAAASSPAYRLLTEFTAFPEKFLFADLVGLDAVDLGRFTDRLELFLYLRSSDPEVERNVSRSTFRLGCTPCVNLMQHRAEPVPLTETTTEFRVVPDVRRPGAMEVYSVDEVTAISPEGDEIACRPFHSAEHGGRSRRETPYWVARRRPAESAGDTVDEGTEIDLTIVDLDAESVARDGWYLDVETTCTNRDLAHRIPIGGAQPRMTLVEGSGLVEEIELLTAPTRALRVDQGGASSWKLVSHLSLGHLSLTGGEDAARALREMLTLYDVRDSAETRAMIGSIRSVTSRRTAGRVPGGRSGGVCQGLEVTVTLDDRAFPTGGAYLFAAVLDRFLAMHCTINSFTRLVARIGEGDEATHRWPARTGGRTLA